MKAFGTFFTVLALGASVLGYSAKSVSAEELSCKAAYSCDFGTGTQVYAMNETEHLPIASMCKIMTLLLSFEAVERGDVSLDEEIEVSERAQSMGGSQVYLQAGLRYRAEDLMRTVAVCSANDACVALAERVSGSENGFIDRMNQRAKELNMNDTLFSNCTGLPKDPQYSCAKDVATMMRELLRHEKYFDLCHVRTEEFQHPDGRTTLITNTNKLLQSYKGCDGGKTGFTNEAGFCLAATAKRGETRIISVAIGTATSKERFLAVEEMFDDAFANYESKEVLPSGSIGEKVNVRGSKTKEIDVLAERPLYTFGKKGETDNVRLEIEYDALKAPIGKGERIGRAVLWREDVVLDETDLLAGEDAARFSWWDAYRDAAENWN